MIVKSSGNVKAKELAKKFVASLEKLLKSFDDNESFGKYIEELFYMPGNYSLCFVYGGEKDCSGYEFSMLGRHGEEIILNAKSSSLDCHPTILTVTYNGEKWVGELDDDVSSVIWDVFRWW